MPRARSVGRSLRLRRPGGPAGVVLRRSRSPGAGGSHAKAADGGPAGGRGAQPRWSQRDGRWRLGAHGPGDPPRGAPGPGAQRGRTVDASASSRARPPCSMGTISSGRRARIRPPTAWRWWPGITRTCRGTPLSCWCCRSPASPVGHTVTTRSSRRGRRGPSPAVPESRSASRPGTGTGRCCSCRTGGGGGSPTSTRASLARGPEPTPLTDLEAEFHGPDWVLGQRTIAEMPDGTVVARMTSSGRDALVPLDPPGRGRGAPPAPVRATLCLHFRALRAR